MQEEIHRGMDGGLHVDETLARFLGRLEERSEVEFAPATFDGRLRIQKVVYLLQAMGGNVGRTFGFNVYYRGPYSPSLANAYYGELSARSPLQGPDDVPPAMLDALAEAADRGKDFLEAAATLHAYSKRPNYGRQEALDLVQSTKPHLDADTLEDAWAFLAEHGLV